VKLLKILACLCRSLYILLHLHLYLYIHPLVSL
jgi:hypothetical protein